MMQRLNLYINRLLAPIDNLLDRLTSYKLVLYFLYATLGWSIFASIAGEVNFKWYFILLSAALIIAVCRITNLFISKYKNIHVNKDSDLITALILTLILSPGRDWTDLMILTVAAVIAMASKYVLIISRWHVFNPAAIGAFASGLLFHHYASWWVGTAFITPVVFLGGMLVLRKMKRFTMVIAFEIIALSVIAFNTYLNQSSVQIGPTLWTALIATPILFFAYIMLTEPFTSPRHMSNYLPYAAIVAFLYSYTKLGISPEQALLLGNIFTYAIEPNRRLPLAFSNKIQEASGIESFIFTGKAGFKYKAGQYMEWTVSQHDTDFRGNRRYLTISSSPTEQDLMFTLRVPEKPSAFKGSIENFKKGDQILADGLAGEFTLPKSDKQKLAFLAGGVGITPFRSMVKYALDFKQQRDIHLIYSANSNEEFAFENLFEEAKDYGLKTNYVTKPLDKDGIKKLIPDLSERTFYISGPYGFVHAMEKYLIDLQVPAKQIKTDYFPGYQ
jgi:ferredoxin-NADP reductase/Na+-translocating ferredoxin:NAD+ oxidoreductase RnfD subunit